MKRFLKSALSAVRYRPGFLPLGVHIVNSSGNLRAVQWKADTTVIDSTIDDGASFGGQTRIVQSHIGARARVGYVCEVTESELNDDSALQDHCRVFRSKLARASYLAERCHAFNMSLGPFSSVGPETLIGLPEHPTDRYSTSPHFYGDFFTASLYHRDDLAFRVYGSVTIGADAWIGARVIIRTGVTIGHGAIIGAGAVVVKDVEPYTIVGGVPAKPIRMRQPQDVVEALLELRWWDWPSDQIKLAAPMLAANDLEGLRKIQARPLD